MVNQYTKGHWSIRGEGETFTGRPNAVFRIDGPNRLPVAEVYSPQWDRQEAADNAQLIVSACNAAMEVNPDNPIAAAEALPELVHSLPMIIRCLDEAVEFADRTSPGTGHNAGLWDCLKQELETILAKCKCAETAGRGDASN
jgi:hypothetical protein